MTEKLISLDLNLAYVPKPVNEYLKEISKVEDTKQKLSKLDDYVKILEEEMRKIDAFKRELPLCMLLLNDAIERLKQEAAITHCKEMNDKAMIDEFVQLKDSSDDVSEKKSWMSSVQLWNNNNNSHCKKQDYNNSEQKQRSEQEDDDRSTCENPIQLGNNRRRGGEGGGQFMPFKAFSFAFKRSEREEEKEVVSQVTGLSLMTPSPPSPELGFCNLVSRTSCNNQMKVLNNKPQNQQLQQQQQEQQRQQLHRKQRRCWSPELHRRFVDALQQLGGSQVATPKQIRELMQVDGLTNDEVKSHLQKYRLHIRKLPGSSAVPVTAWLAQDQYKNIPQSNSPQGTLHASGISKGISGTGGDSMEAQDDHQSESIS